MLVSSLRRFTCGTLLLLAAGTAARAQDLSCGELEARLAALTTGGGSIVYQRYDAAVAEQRDELAIARQQAEQQDCGFSLGEGSDTCQAINLTIERMQSNLADLQRKRTALAKRSRTEAQSERGDLLAALEAEGCRGGEAARRAEPIEPEQATGTVAENDGGLFDRLSRGSIEFVPPDQGTIEIETPSFDEDSVRAYRTICVRTCDGYYFPMSASSSRNDFARDQENCESICPGTEVRTYYQRSSDYDVTRMMSTASDEPYAEMSTAYLYRSADAERPPACGCGKLATEQNFSIIAGEGSAATEVVQAKPEIPRPWPRPDTATDPETLANRDGGLTSEQVAELLKPRLTKRLPAGERKVRVVGPTFLPDPAAAEDRPVPAQRRAQ